MSAPLTEPPVTFSFVGIDKETALLKDDVIALAKTEFKHEQVTDFEDPLKGWENVLIDGKHKRELEPMERLCHRGGLFLKNLRVNGVPKLKAGSTLGFFNRFGFDAWYGANGHRLDMLTLRLWGPLIEHGLVPLGFRPPDEYLHTDGNDHLRHLLRRYCAEIPGQSFVIIPATLPRREKVHRIMDIAHEKLDRRRRRLIA